MIRRVPVPLLVLDIVGAIVGFAITVPLTFALIAPAPSGWISDQGWYVAIYVLVGVLLWGAAAIARLSPPLALAIAWGAAIVQMGCGLWPSLANIAVFAVLFSVGAWGSRRIMWIGGASAVVGGVLAGVYVPVLQMVGMRPDAMQMLIFGLLTGSTVLFSLALAWGAGLLWRSVRKSRQNYDAQLRAEAKAIEEQERVSIARDMHDVVAHSLAVVIAQADGARYAAAARPEVAQEALGTIATTARGALSDVRMLLTQLRHRQGDGPQPTLADLETLFAQVRQAGIEPRVTVDPMPPGEPPGAIQLAVYRILQEALTNALRHGAGDVDVRLAWLPDRVDIEVRNTVTGDAPSPSGGHGIVGMRERAQLVGGTLVAGRNAGMFTVTAALPIGSAAVDGNGGSE